MAGQVGDREWERTDRDDVRLLAVAVDKFLVAHFEFVSSACYNVSLLWLEISV